MSTKNKQLSLPGILPNGSRKHRIRRPDPTAKTNRMYWNPIDSEDVTYARAYYLLKNHHINLFSLRVNGGSEDTLVTPDGEIEVTVTHQPDTGIVETEVLARDKADVEADIIVQEYLNGNHSTGRLLDHLADQSMILVEKDMVIKARDHELKEKDDLLDGVMAMLSRMEETLRETGRSVSEIKDRIQPGSDYDLPF